MTIDKETYEDIGRLPSRGDVRIQQHQTATRGSQHSAREENGGIESNTMIPNSNPINPNGRDTGRRESHGRDLSNFINSSSPSGSQFEKKGPGYFNPINFYSHNQNEAPMARISQNQQGAYSNGGYNSQSNQNPTGSSILSTNSQNEYTGNHIINRNHPVTIMINGVQSIPGESPYDHFLSADFGNPGSNSIYNMLNAIPFHSQQDANDGDTFLYEVNNNLVEQSDRLTLYCTTCNKIFTCQDSLRQHMMSTHKNSENKLTMGFNTTGGIVNHHNSSGVITHSPLGALDTMPVTIKKKTEVRQTKPLKEYKCVGCKKHYKNHNGLKYHMQKYHPKEYSAKKKNNKRTQPPKKDQENY